MERRIVITGGSGFIGSNIIEYFRLLGSLSILNIDVASPLDERHKVYWRHVDILDRVALENIINSFQPHFIIHLAARTDLKGKTIEDYDTNTTGTANVIQISKKVGSVKKVIFASSMLVCKTGHIPLSDTEYSAGTVYGTSKVEMEKLIRKQSLPYEWSIVRPTSIWGPGFKAPYRDFFETVKRGEFFDIGKRYSTKTYGYIGNTVYQIVSILENRDADRKVFYLGDDPPIFISDWAREVALVFHQAEPKKIPFWFAKFAALFGDLLSKFNISFPMTSFRLKNMTTDNIFDLRELYSIAPKPPYSRLQGIELTVDWLNNKERNK